MTVDDHEGRLMRIRHSASLQVGTDIHTVIKETCRSMTEQTESAELPTEDGMAFFQALGVGALAERMGIKFTEFSRDRAVATMPVKGNTQPLMLLHGGAYVVLGESMGSMHANFVAPRGYVAVGVDINATHTGSATSGFVTGVCTPIKLGRSVAVHEIIITDEHDQRCSTVRITNYYKKHQR